MAEKIALFPIPNSVVYPGTVFPLHVFEPRYRKMVKYCQEEGVLLAICHTVKELSPARPNQTPQEALQSNQASYQPVSVFAAGECELIETLDDGRLLLNVHLKARYRSLNEQQVLPFLLHECEIYPDLDLDEAEIQQAALLQEKIYRRLLVISSQQPEACEKLKSLNLLEKTPQDFSFQIFAMLQFRVEKQQAVLEMNSPIDRLNWLLNHLNR